MQKHVQWQSPMKETHVQNRENSLLPTQRKQPENVEVSEQSTDRKQQQTNQHQQLERKYQHNSINTMKQDKLMIQEYMNESEYTLASEHIKRIKYKNIFNKKSRVRALSAEHQIQKASIKKAHVQELKQYKNSWNQIFNKFKVYEQEKIYELKRFNNKQRQIHERRIIKRCQSARPCLQIAKIKQLQLQQKGLKKRGSTSQLRRIRAQKQKLKKQCQRQMEKRYKSIVEQQNKKLQTTYSKRYNSFMEKVREQKQDQKKNYIRGQKILKQKFKNVMKSLQHEQTLQINQILKTKTYGGLKYQKI